MRYTNGKNISIVFEGDVLNHFDKYRQKNSSSKEAGGQLFARYHDAGLIISKATGPSEKDKRGKFFFWPSRANEQKDIEDNHKNGLHFVGDWHTHPQVIPKPSADDVRNICDCFIKSDHRLNYFVMVIVGTAPFPEGLSVSVHNTETASFLHAA